MILALVLSLSLISVSSPTNSDGHPLHPISKCSISMCLCLFHNSTSSICSYASSGDDNVSHLSV